MKVSQIAELVNGTASGDLGRDIQAVASLESATRSQLAYVESATAIEQTTVSEAGCLLVPQGSSRWERTVITVRNPKLALIKVAEMLHPDAAPPSGIHPAAVVAPDARLEMNSSIGPNAVIESGVTIGEGTVIGAGVSLGRDVRVGKNCVLHARVAVYAGAQIGNRVIIHSGAVIGSDGFGYVLAEGRHVKFPQLGKIIIGDDVEIGSNTTIDRGSLDSTVIGEGTKIDNLVQIAHNVKIGRHCIIVSQTGISGSSEIGDYVVMAGQVGVGDHAHIEDRVVVGGQAGVLPGKIVRAGSIVWGTPCRPMSEFKKTVARLARLESLTEKVNALSRQLKNDTR